jgi:hypothetical protein
MVAIVLVDLLGYLDALVRLPVVPSFDSVYGIRLLASVAVKTVAYSVGFVDIHKHTLLFLSALFMNVWLLPVLYLLVVPYGDRSPFRNAGGILTLILHPRKEILSSIPSIWPMSGKCPPSDYFKYI